MKPFKIQNLLRLTTVIIAIISSKLVFSQNLEIDQKYYISKIRKASKYDVVDFEYEKSSKIDFLIETYNNKANELDYSSVKTLERGRFNLNTLFVPGSGSHTDSHYFARLESGLTCIINVNEQEAYEKDIKKVHRFQLGDLLILFIADCEDESSFALVETKNGYSIEEEFVLRDPYSGTYHTQK